MDLQIAYATDAENPIAGDLKMTNGQLLAVEGVDAIKQHIRVRLQWFKGEWPQSPSEGMPYWSHVIIKNPKSRHLRKMFTAAIEGVPGVSRVASLEIEINKSTRDARVVFDAVLESGEVVADDFGLFEVEGF